MKYSNSLYNRAIPTISKNLQTMEKLTERLKKILQSNKKRHIHINIRNTFKSKLGTSNKTEIRCMLKKILPLVLSTTKRQLSENSTRCRNNNREK